MISWANVFGYGRFAEDPSYADRMLGKGERRPAILCGFSRVPYGDRGFFDLQPDPKSATRGYVQRVDAARLGFLDRAAKAQGFESEQLIIECDGTQFTALVYMVPKKTATVA